MLNESQITTTDRLRSYVQTAIVQLPDFADGQAVSKTWTDQLAETGKAFQTIGGEFSKYISLPISGAGSALLKFGADFETEMKNLAAITGMSAEELKALEKGIEGIPVH